MRPMMLKTVLAGVLVLLTTAVFAVPPVETGYGGDTPFPVQPPMGRVAYVPATATVTSVGVFHPAPGAGWLAAVWSDADQDWKVPGNSVGKSIQVCGTVTLGTGGKVNVGDEEVVFTWETAAGWNKGSSCVEWSGNDFVFTVWEVTEGDLTPKDGLVGPDYVRVKLSLWQTWQVNNVTTPFLTGWYDCKLSY